MQGRDPLFGLKPTRQAVVLRMPLAALLCCSCRSSERVDNVRVGAVIKRQRLESLRLVLLEALKRRVCLHYKSSDKDQAMRRNGKA